MNNETVNLLTKFHKDNRIILEGENANDAHTIWVGDFNRHHPYWDNPRDTWLFTNEAIKAAELLIEAVAEAGLEMALPGKILTHCHNVTKRWSRLDQVFLSKHSDNLLITCDTYTDQRGVSTDHLPIVMELNLAVNMFMESPHLNFRNVDWQTFCETLVKN